jgi:hypothetical protein
MSELYPVLILKGLGWLLMARFSPYSRAVVAQMWPRGREGKSAIRWLGRGRGRVSYYAAVLLLSIAFTKFKLKQLEPFQPESHDPSFVPNTPI